MSPGGGHFSPDGGHFVDGRERPRPRFSQSCGHVVPAHWTLCYRAEGFPGGPGAEREDRPGGCLSPRGGRFAPAQRVFIRGWGSGPGPLFPSAMGIPRRTGRSAAGRSPRREYAAGRRAKKRRAGRPAHGVAGPEGRPFREMRLRFSAAPDKLYPEHKTAGKKTPSKTVAGARFSGNLSIRIAGPSPMH